MNINSKFEDLKKLFASLEDFGELKDKVHEMDLNMNDQGRKINRVAQEQESVGMRVTGHDGQIAKLFLNKADKSELKEIVDKIKQMDEDFEDMITS